MNKYLKQYNKVISEKCLKIGASSMLSPTLCRVEAQSGLFRSIFIKSNSSNFSFYKILSENFGFLIKPFRDLIICNSSRRRILPKDIRNLFITYCDYRNVTNTKDWREEIFRGIKPNSENIILAIPLGRNPKQLNDLNHFILSCNQKHHIYSIHSFVKKKYILKAFFRSIISIKEIFKNIFFVEIKIFDKNLKANILMKLLKDLSSGRIYSNELYKLLWQRISNENTIDKIIFPWESQCWERLLINQFLSKKTTLIGYQHTGFSYGLLQHFNTPFDNRLKINPQYIFTAGEVQRDILKKVNGLKNTKIYKLGSLRCESSISKKKLLKKLNISINNIYVCLGYNSIKYDLIINSLKKIKTTINISVLIHPINKSYNFRGKLEKNINIVYKRDNEIIKKSDILLVDDNSMMIEGWSLNVPTVILDSDKFGLTKRDWGSPILHISIDRLSKINSEIFIKNLRKSILNYINSEYSEKYFNKINFKKMMNYISNLKNLNEYEV